MPDISLLDPVVLRGVVEKFVVPESLIMLNRVTQSPWPYPTVTWDIIKGSRQVAAPTSPNVEATIINNLGRQQASASLLYFREKKIFDPQTLHWLRTPGRLAEVNAEAAVMREITDLNNRFDNAAELMLFGAMSGNLSVSIQGVTVNIDYQFPASHKPSPPTAWASATPTQIVQDVVGWKRLIARHGRVPAREAFCNEFTLTQIVNTFAEAQSGSGGTVVSYLSDRMKDQYYNTGMIAGFMGLTWNVCESVYESATGGELLFVGDNQLYLGNYTDQRPLELIVGPSADDDAPNGFTGKYAKTFKEPDPSVRQYLLEWNILPIVTRPEQMLFVSNVGFNTSLDTAFLN